MPTPTLLLLLENRHKYFTKKSLKCILFFNKIVHNIRNILNVLNILNVHKIGKVYKLKVCINTVCVSCFNVYNTVIKLVWVRLQFNT